MLCQQAKIKNSSGQRSLAKSELEGQEGLEPSTFCLRGRRSNQLSYWPTAGVERAATGKFYQNTSVFARPPKMHMCRAAVLLYHKHKSNEARSNMNVLPTVFAEYDYTYTTTTGTESAAASAGMIVLGLVALAVIVFLIVCSWKVFVKAGKPGWASIVPGYSSWVLAEIGGKPGWWGLMVLLGFIPFVGAIVALIFSVLILLGVARNFGKDEVFAIFGLILFPFVGFPILAFSNAKYMPHAAGAAGQVPDAPYPASHNPAGPGGAPQAPQHHQPHDPTQSS